MFDMSSRMTRKRLQEFADMLKKLQMDIGFKVSSRGWCYQLEQFGLIDKSQFDLVNRWINRCRKEGYLPIDFVAEETARKFSGVEVPTAESPISYMRTYLEAALDCKYWYTPDWWDGEEFYIQMVVEKIDLKTLFQPVCERYHIPIATSKGWASILQRAEYARRFKEAEERGLKCVLLYAGDHDPDGLRISEFIRKNLEDLRYIEWEDGMEGYDPEYLIIDRFGLNYDFIVKNKLTWIENLITGSGKDLASPTHKNHYMPYVQEYLRKYGARKCEANALVVRPKEARELCRSAIEAYLGTDALSRFREKRNKIFQEVESFHERTGLKKAIKTAIEIIDEEEPGDE